MQFNNFVWSLYANSESGKKAIDKFRTLDFAAAKKLYDLSCFNFEEDEGVSANGKEMEFWFAEVVKETASAWDIKSFSEAQKKYEDIFNDGIWITHPELKEAALVFGSDDDEDIESWSEYVADISIGLYLAQPEFFLPYFFRTKFYLFQKISETFAINLPEIPKKGDHLKRALYYVQISEALYEFRKLYNLSPTEMCAFLDDFAPHFIEDIEGKELPEPLKAWIIKGGINDNGDYESIVDAGDSFASYWQGNIDTRRGDILVFYFLTPRKKIHFVCRALSDGFYDPYFHYHSTALVGLPLEVPGVEFSELNAHPLLKNNPGVRAHMQGPSGVPLTSQEYDALLGIFKEKGFENSVLPKLQKIDFLPDLQLRVERDVEVHLIEPFLKRLGYEESDWIRQMPVRMGRGERNYPDYIIGTKQSKSEQSAKLVVEAKYRISNRKQLSEAFFQATSYALRLQAKLAAVASFEGVWISEFNNGKFDIEKAIHKDWNELQNSDHLHEIKLLIGKGELK